MYNKRKGTTPALTPENFLRGEPLHDVNSTGAQPHKRSACQNRLTVDSQTAIAMVRSRKKPGLGPVLQLPKDGFEHPFHDSESHMSGHHGKEHPRTVSGDSPNIAASF